MAGTANLDALDLAALLCSRVCHDLISPVGAIMNGIEVMEDGKDEETKQFALDLIKSSSQKASARLRFCRLAFGASGSAGARLDLGEAESVARGFIADDKTTLGWNLPKVLLPKNRVKLLLNMLVIAGQAIPRGGALTVEPVGQGDAMGFRVTATGPIAKVPPPIAGVLAGEAGGEAIDAHKVQPLYTRMLAKECGLTVAAATEGEAVVVSAR